MGCPPSSIVCLLSSSTTGSSASSCIQQAFDRRPRPEAAARVRSTTNSTLGPVSAFADPATPTCPALQPQLGHLFAFLLLLFTPPEPFDSSARSFLLIHLLVCVHPCSHRLSFCLPEPSSSATPVIDVLHYSLCLPSHPPSHSTLWFELWGII